MLDSRPTTKGSYLGVAIQRDCIGIGVVFFSAVDLRVKSSLWTPQVKV